LNLSSKLAADSLVDSPLSQQSLVVLSKPVKPYMELARPTLPPLVRLARPLLDESFADFRTGTLLAEALSG